MSVRLEVSRPSALSLRTRDEITAFITRYMTYVRSDVDARLARASYVLLYRDRRGAIVATTAVREVRASIEGRAVRVLVTSMVAVDPAHRRAGLLARMGAYSFARARLRWTGPLYWAALAASAEGYAQMAHNFERCWPSEGADIPSEIDALMRAIAEDFAHPIVRDALGRWLVLGTLVPVEQRRWFTGAAAYFERAVDGHPTGASVLCVAPLSARSMGRVLLRHAARTVERRSAPRSGVSADARVAVPTVSSNEDQSGWSSMPSQYGSPRASLSDPPQSSTNTK